PIKSSAASEVYKRQRQASGGNAQAPRSGGQGRPQQARPAVASPAAGPSSPPARRTMSKWG
ncbi:serine/threonine protein kinase, partial [Corallococcus aberystwythensis]